MSLINDALKRAGEQAPPPRAAGPEFRPVANAPARSVLIPGLIGAVLILLIGAGLLFWKSMQPVARPVAVQPPAAAAPSVAAASQVEAKPVVPKVEPPKATVATPTPVVEPTSARVAAVKATSSTEPAPAPSVAVAPAAPATVTRQVSEQSAATPVAATPVPSAPAVPQFPELKLQGILYNRSNPSALINGKTLSVGQKVSGARVTKIERDSVTLEWNGETRQLELSN